MTHPSDIVMQVWRWKMYKSSIVIMRGAGGGETGGAIRIHICESDECEWLWATDGGEVWLGNTPDSEIEHRYSISGEREQWVVLTSNKKNTQRVAISAAIVINMKVFLPVF